MNGSYSSKFPFAQKLSLKPAVLAGASLFFLNNTNFSSFIQDVNTSWQFKVDNKIIIDILILLIIWFDSLIHVCYTPMTENYMGKKTFETLNWLNMNWMIRFKDQDYFNVPPWYRQRLNNVVYNIVKIPSGDHFLFRNSNVNCRPKYVQESK